MSVLLLRNAAPIQSWGDSSRFNHRGTSNIPTKSGILGLVAAAQGRRRTDPVEDLIQLRFGVRIDQPGSVLRDFQTTHDQNGKSKPLSYRTYLTDAVFVAGLEGERETLERLDRAIRKPRYPLYLGRRSCPPDVPLTMGVIKGDLVPVLEGVSWQASEWFRKKSTRLGGYSAILVCDQSPSSPGVPTQLMRDVPISWDPDHREFGWRNVSESTVQFAQTEYSDHNPFELGGNLIVS